MTQVLANRPLDTQPRATNLLELQDLVVEFHGKNGSIRANDGITLSVPRGITLGVDGVVAAAASRSCAGASCAYCRRRPVRGSRARSSMRGATFFGSMKRTCGGCAAPRSA